MLFRIIRHVLPVTRGGLTLALYLFHSIYGNLKWPQWGGGIKRSLVCDRQANFNLMRWCGCHLLAFQLYTLHGVRGMFSRWSQSTSHVTQRACVSRFRWLKGRNRRIEGHTLRSIMTSYRAEEVEALFFKLVYDSGGSLESTGQALNLVLRLKK